MSDANFLFTMTLAGINSDWHIAVSVTLSENDWYVDSFTGLDGDENAIEIVRGHPLWSRALHDLYRNNSVYDMIDEAMMAREE